MADLTEWDDDITSGDEMGDTIIELTDIADKVPQDTQQETIIELTDIVVDESHDLNLDIIKEESTQDPAIEIDSSFVDTPLDDSPVNPVQEIVSPGDLSVSPEQIEAALERVVEKKFADKIESILFEVMEKVIEKEINEIKESLQKDLDQLGNV